MRLCVVIALVTFTLTLVSAYADKSVFQLGVSTTQYLPPPMYGTWQVRATLVSSSNPAYFPPSSQDIWTLAQEGQTVTLSNPSTGAFATIAVNEVDGNRATFTHRADAGRNHTIEENPSVTVDKDQLFGQTRNRLIIKRKGQVVQAYTAVYKISAVRIGGSRVQFGQPALPTDYPEFDIAPIQQAQPFQPRYPFLNPNADRQSKPLR
jgi:hypothetical protein